MPNPDSQANYPEKAPPKLQFGHIDNGEVNLNTEGLAPEEQVAAKFCSWLIDKLDEIEPQEKDTGGTDQEASYHRSGKPNLLQPASIVLSIHRAGDEEGAEFYTASLYNIIGERTQLAIYLSYESIPSPDATSEDEEEHIVTDVGIGFIGFSDLWLEDVKDESKDEFIAGFETAVNTLQEQMNLDYEPVPKE